MRHRLHPVSLRIYIVTIVQDMLTVQSPSLVYCPSPFLKIFFYKIPHILHHWHGMPQIINVDRWYHSDVRRGTFRWHKRHPYFVTIAMPVRGIRVFLIRTKLVNIHCSSEIFVVLPHCGNSMNFSEVDAIIVPSLPQFVL